MEKTSVTPAGSDNTASTIIEQKASELEKKGKENWLKLEEKLKEMDQAIIKAATPLEFAGFVNQIYLEIFKIFSNDFLNHYWSIPGYSSIPVYAQNLMFEKYWDNPKAKKFVKELWDKKYKYTADDDIFRDKINFIAEEELKLNPDYMELKAKGSRQKSREDDERQKKIEEEKIQEVAKRYNVKVDSIGFVERNPNYDTELTREEREDIYYFMDHVGRDDGLLRKAFKMLSSKEQEEYLDFNGVLHSGVANLRALSGKAFKMLSKEQQEEYRKYRDTPPEDDMYNSGLLALGSQIDKFPRQQEADND